MAFHRLLGEDTPIISQGVLCEHPRRRPAFPLREAALACSRDCFHRIINPIDYSPFTCSMTTSPAATETNSILLLLALETTPTIMWRQGADRKGGGEVGKGHDDYDCGVP